MLPSRPFHLFNQKRHTSEERNKASTSMQKHFDAGHPAGFQKYYYNQFGEIKREGGERKALGVRQNLQKISVLSTKFHRYRAPSTQLATDLGWNRKTD